MEKMLPIENYRNFNYALLDFASLICKERGKPLCKECFMNKYCLYYKEKEKEIYDFTKV